MNNNIARIEQTVGQLSTAVSSLSTQLRDFVQTSTENRIEQKEEIRLIWTAMKENQEAAATAAALQHQTAMAAIDKQHATAMDAINRQSEQFAIQQGKGEITLGKIIGLCSFLVTLVAFAVAINNAYMSKWFEKVDAKFTDVATHREYSERDRHDIRYELANEFQRVDHESDRRDKGQQAMIDNLSDDIETLKEWRIEITEWKGKTMKDIYTLFNKSESLKADLRVHENMPSHPTSKEGIIEGRLSALEGKVAHIDAEGSTGILKAIGEKHKHEGK